MKKIIFTAIVVLQILFSPHITCALNVETHKAINKSIANSTLNGFSLDQYLINNLGFPQGIGETFSGQKAGVWLELGGEYEDAPPWSLPYRRSVNHFHNPINEQGFSGIWDTGFRSGMSATLWATQPRNSQNTDGNYSWADVRGYYLNALTSTDKTTRDSNFASTFRGLGQLMHLVQDMSVPEHTRNDGHYLLCCDYEHWVESNPWSVTTAASAPAFFTGAISSIKSFMDTDTYTGLNPEVTAYATIGLSEFTNANFFSDDSIFEGFTYPSVAGATLWTDTTNNRQYLKKTTEGVPVEHLAVSSWLYFYRTVSFPQYQDNLPLGLDSKVYSDYADLLLPRAVGYSASLLKYFFRGKMDMVKVQNTSGQYIIKNDSDETMDGVFSLYYDDVNDNRYLVNSWNLSGSNAIPPHGQSNPVFFAKPTSPQPKEKGKYILVFQGNLGNEIGAFVGKVVSGLCDGTWVLISNTRMCTWSDCIFCTSAYIKYILEEFDFIGCDVGHKLCRTYNTSGQRVDDYYLNAQPYTGYFNCGPPSICQNPSTVKPCPEAPDPPADFPYWVFTNRLIYEWRCP